MKRTGAGASAREWHLEEVEELVVVLVAKRTQLGPQHLDYLLHPGQPDHAWNPLTPAGQKATR